MADTGKLKRENTALLRQAMQNGSAGKNDLARLTHLSFPTVSRIVDEMVECGEAQEIGTAASTGGRCAMQYRLNPQYRLFLCLRLEQDTLHWFVCDLDGTPLEQEQQTCSGDVRELLDTLLMRVRARYPRLAAVVLGFAGTMHNGIVTESFGYPELRGVSLSAYLRDKTGLPCMAARDMQVVAAGYAAQYTPTPKAVVCIYIGKLGAGAGIVLDGKVWGGAAGFAGELHYLPIKHNLEYAQNHFAGAAGAGHAGDRAVPVLRAGLHPRVIYLGKKDGGNHMKYFIFDIDGTLIDSSKVDQWAMRTALAEFGYEFTYEQLIFSFGMPGRRALAKLSIPAEQVEPIMARWEALAYDRLDEIPMYDGIPEVIAELRNGGCQCGIVTSRTRLQLEQGIKPIGFTPWFDEIICADDVEHPKPAPDALLECLRRFGCKPEDAVYIGDSEYDMQCAKSAGVKSVLALWGCSEAEKLTSDLRFEHPAEILTLR